MGKMGEQNKMLKISDCNLPNPKRWPGKFSKDNTGGTLMEKEEWIKKEAKLWFDEMKKHEKYDSTLTKNKNSLSILSPVNQSK